MAAMNEIERFGKEIGSQFGAEKVLLFGSYAAGTEQSDSDVDLLVVLAHQGRSIDKSVEIRMKLRPPFPVDILVRSPENVRQRLDMGDDFMRQILDNGKVLYEANSR
jgi:predicted nucleotidyltransferase